MLSDVTGIIMSTATQADYFMLVTCAQCEPAVVCDENEAAMADLLIMVFSGESQ